MPRIFITLVWLSCAAALAQAQWRSVLYPETGYEPAAANLDTDKVLQDFSYAGYRAGAVAIPTPTGPVFNVTAAPYNADPTGTLDATSAIQSAINAAKAAGGGVVFLPAGTYRLSVPTGQPQALLINASNIVLRGAGVGQTFLLNTTTVDLRSKAVIRVSDATTMSFYRTSGTTAVALSQDVLNSTNVIPVASTSGLAVGDTVVVRNDIRDPWIEEHGETYWLGHGPTLDGLTYRRTVIAVDSVAKTITVDVPIRYALKLRDNARVVRLTRAPISNIGVEDFSFANVQSDATTGWAEGDYAVPDTAAYEINGFFFIVFERVKDSWLRRTATYQPAGNTTTAHLLSGAFSARECTHLTIEHCVFQRPQYGGGGGNGYMFRLLDSAESLIQFSEAHFSRHGFQFSGTGAAGNVIHACLDSITGRATGAVGAVGYPTGGRASDHHQHFSQANLVDVCTAHDSWFEARYRSTSGSVPYHGISAAHSVFWNTEGTGTVADAVVKSEQARYGYIIGTRGNRSNAQILNTQPSKHGPLDHLEGAGQGATLVPFSLFQDQRARRLGAAASLPETVTLPFPADTIDVTPLGFFAGAEPIDPNELQIAWEADAAVQLTPLAAGAVRARVPGPGEWTLTCATTHAGLTQRRTTRVIAEPAAPTAPHTLTASADTYVDGSTANVAVNYGTANPIRIKRANTANTTRHALLRFSLTDLAGAIPTAARLVLSAKANDTRTTFAGWQISVRPITSAWSETTATWLNQPTYGNAIATYEPSDTNLDVIDITDHVLARYAGGASTIELALIVNFQPDTSLYDYHSRESPTPGLRPRIEVDAIPAASRFTIWAAQHIANSAHRAPQADPDGDGLPNLLEMLLGTSPVVANATTGATLDATSSTVGFEFTYPAPAFSRVRLEQSTDLSTWSTLPLRASHVTVLPNARRQVAVPVALDAPRQFWRLRIEPETGTTIP